MKLEIKTGDLVTVNNFQWSVEPFQPGEIALILDIKKKDSSPIFSYEFNEDKHSGYDMLVMFANDCKTMWVSSSRVKKVDDKTKK